MLRAERIGFRYTSESAWIFRNLDLNVRRGSVCAILGPNGRGKTTLLKTLLGLVPLNEGAVSREGELAYVPQQNQTPFSYTCLDMVVMGRARSISLLSSPSATDYRLAHRAMERIGVAHFAHRPVNALSGGERQLVMIARAVASEADLLVLDEPTSALDFLNQDRVLGALDGLARDDGKTIVFTTHSPQHALSVADQALAMHAGQDIRIGPVDQVLAEDNLSALYGLPVRHASVPEGGSFLKAIVPVFGRRQAAGARSS